MGPTKLPFQAVANPAKARRFLTDQERATLPNLLQERRLADAGRADEKHMAAPKMEPAQSLDPLLATEKCEALVQ